MAKRTTVDLSDCDVNMIHAIMQEHMLGSEAAAIRWAVQMMGRAVEFVVKSPSGQLLTWKREG